MDVKMNFQDHAGVVHIVMQEPIRPTRRTHSLAGQAGFTQCEEWFRWRGMSEWERNELIGIPTESNPTCMLCVGDPYLD